MRPIATPRTNLTYILKDGTEENNLPCERVPLPGAEWYVELPDGSTTKVPGPGRYDFRVEDRDQHRNGDGKDIHEQVLEAKPTSAAIRSAWLLTDDEQAHIARTGLLELTIFSEPIPPLALAVIEPGDFTDYGWGPETEQPDPPLARSHADLALGALYAMLEQHLTTNTGYAPDDFLPPADKFLDMWHEALARTSIAATDPEDPEQRPSENAADPREPGCDA